MKIVFFGSSDFSVPFLETLLNSPHKISAVVTTPSKPQGRGLKIQPNPVQVLAEGKGVTCLVPAKLKDEQALDAVKKMEPDVLVVASYGKILPASWLALPKKYPLNVHPSILPKYRGAAPVNWQIIRGEKQAGVSIFKMTQEMDSGDLAAQKAFPILDEDDAPSLLGRLAREGTGLLTEVLEKAESGTLRFAPQNHAEATLAPKLKKDDGLIDWKKSAAKIANLVRGLAPWPGTYILFKGESLKIIKARLQNPACAEGKPGQILEINKSGFIRIQTGQGALLIERVQPAGKREMTAHEFALGQRLQPGDELLDR